MKVLPFVLLCPILASFSETRPGIQFTILGSQYFLHTQPKIIGRNGPVLESAGQSIDNVFTVKIIIFIHIFLESFILWIEHRFGAATFQGRGKLGFSFRFSPSLHRFNDLIVHSCPGPVILAVHVKFVVFTMRLLLSITFAWFSSSPVIPVLGVFILVFFFIQITKSWFFQFWFGFFVIILENFFHFVVIFLWIEVTFNVIIV